MADRIIRALTAVTVVLLGAVAAVVSFRHAYAVVTAHGEDGLTAVLSPLTVDGMVLVAGLVLLDAARRGQRAPRLAVVTLALGIAATVAVNALYGLSHGLLGAVVAAWPAVALVLSSELLMGLIRRGQTRGEPLNDDPVVVEAAPLDDGQDHAPDAVAPGAGPVEVEQESAPEPGVTADPLVEVAREHFAETLAAGALPSVRQLRREHRIGHPRAVRLREALSRS